MAFLNEDRDRSAAAVQALREPTLRDSPHQKKSELTTENGVATAALDTAVPLTGLAPGQPAKLLGSTLPSDDGELLTAMGLAAGNELLVCRQGHPCIVRSGGTRIGLSAEFARQILVIPFRNGSEKTNGIEPGIANGS